MRTVAYFLKRVTYAIVILLSVVSLTFVWYRFIPSNPFDAVYGFYYELWDIQPGEPFDISTLDDWMMETYRVDPSAPVHEAYLDYLMSIVLHQDFGVAVMLGGEPVFQLLFSGLPWTAFIAAYGLLLGFVTELLLDAYIAWADESKANFVLAFFRYFSNSVPYYFVAIVGMSVLAFEIGAFPVGGHLPPEATPGFNVAFMIGLIHYAFLPIVAAFFAGFGGGRTVRQHSGTLRNREFMRSAKIRGVAPQRLISVYVLRNSIRPIYRNLLIGISVIFSSSVIIEYFFRYVGIGWYMAAAVVLDPPDFALLSGGIIFFTAFTLVAVLIADAMYLWIDPRTEVDRGGIIPGW